MSSNNQDLKRQLKELSDSIDLSQGEVSVILAAGHGKRIKSEKSKMLHEIWGRPSVSRVAEATLKGLGCDNQIIVVGIKALEVAQALGKRKNRIFVFQEEQRGTGDAVKQAVRQDSLAGFEGIVYVFPGDMGLLTDKTVARFRRSFLSSRGDMMVLTGIYRGPLEDNQYGRIIKSKKNGQEIIEIKEFRDIAALGDDETYVVDYRNQEESFAKDELLRLEEFNTGVYAFKCAQLREFVSLLKPENVQGEIYATDLIKIFRERGLTVLSSPVRNNDLVIAFNVKSVLKHMEDLFRAMMYDRLKDIITIDDAEDFYIAEETIRRIMELDKKYPALDIRIGKGVSLGSRVFLSRGVTIFKNSRLRGHVRLGENVTIGDNVDFSTYPDQTIDIGRGSHIYSGNVFKGRVKIGDNVRIESGVRITGSRETPVVIGNNAVIKGITYIFGSLVDEGVVIQHSILEKVRVRKVTRENGDVQQVRYIFPRPEGSESITPLKKPQG